MMLRSQRPTDAVTNKTKPYSEVGSHYTGKAALVLFQVAKVKTQGRTEFAIIKSQMQCSRGCQWIRAEMPAFYLVFCTHGTIFSSILKNIRNWFSL